MRKFRGYLSFGLLKTNVFLQTEKVALLQQKNL